jgi:hypothetical protein
VVTDRVLPPGEADGADRVDGAVHFDRRTRLAGAQGWQAGGVAAVLQQLAQVIAVRTMSLTVAPWACAARRTAARSARATARRRCDPMGWLSEVRGGPAVPPVVRAATAGRSCRRPAGRWAIARSRARAASSRRAPRAARFISAERPLSDSASSLDRCRFGSSGEGRVQNQPALRSRRR